MQQGIEVLSIVYGELGHGENGLQKQVDRGCMKLMKI